MQPVYIDTPSARACIRDAVPGDEGVIFQLIREIAIYEKMLDEVTSSPEIIAETLFEKRAGRALVLEVDGKAQGYAIFFTTVSTFTGRTGMYLEDLFVREDMRGLGLGKALLLSVARIAHEEGCARMEWQCLDWNEPSLRFYQSLGAKRLDCWVLHRLDAEGIAALAESE